MLTSRHRFAVASALRDWIHKQPWSECDRGADTCPDWPKAFEIRDVALGALPAMFTREQVEQIIESCLGLPAGDGAAVLERFEAMDALAEELRIRQETAHERVRCPRCMAPAGVMCHSVMSGRLNKHPHEERLRADGIMPR